MKVRGSIRSVDASLEEAALAAPGESIRIRIQPLIRRESGEGKTEFRAWRQLHWILDVSSVDEGRELREALDAFFLIAERQGIGALKRHLAPLTTVGAAVAG